MSMVKWTFVALLILPAAEIGVFVLVALMIGWLWTIILFLLTSLLGVCLLRRSGRRDFDRVRRALAERGLRAADLETPGAAALLGGILLVFPGFITDLLGLGLFVPQFRRWAAAGLKSTLKKRKRNDTTVIDLEPDEWHQIPDRRPKHPHTFKDRS
jgi:UPF0716 protein FxsA